MPISAQKKVTWRMKREKKMPLKNVSKKNLEKKKRKKNSQLSGVDPSTFC